MVKYSEQEILKAYDEFNSDKDWVSGNAHEIIAYDFFSHNQVLSEFLKHRDISLQYLYYCVNAVSRAETYEKRKELVIGYCEVNDIFFNKYFTLAYLHQLGTNPHLPLPNIEDYRILIGKKEKVPEDYEVVISDLAVRLNEAKNKKIRFGIMEYYAYYDTDLLELKDYLDDGKEFKPEYETVRAFIEKLELNEELEAVPYRDSLEPTKNSHSICGLYCNDEAFREVVSQLLITRYPVLTGTLNYAYSLQSEGKLGTLSKSKIKRKYESKLR